MAEKLCKYKLVKFGNGWTSPAGIIDGGQVWEINKNISETILVGKINIIEEKSEEKSDLHTNSIPISLPEGVIEIITQEDWDNHKKEQFDNRLKKYKSSKYKEIESLGIEAIRDKLLGRIDGKWDEYISKCEKIKNLKEIPEIPEISNII